MKRDGRFSLAALRAVVGLVTILSAQIAASESTAPLAPYVPTPDQLSASYQRADRVGRDFAQLAHDLRITPHWLDNGKRFWFCDEPAKSRRVFAVVDSATGAASPAFDHARLATVLGTTLGSKVDPGFMPFRDMEFVDDGKAIHFETGGQGWKCALADYSLTKASPMPRPGRPPADPWIQATWPADRDAVTSPDGKWVAQIQGENISVKPKDGEFHPLSQSGTPGQYFSRFSWSPDSQRIIGVRVTPGDRKLVYLIQSTPAGGGPAKFEQRMYDRPGDRVDTFDLWTMNPSAGTSEAVKVDPIDYGDMPFARWETDGHRFTYEKMDRGYSRWRIMEVDTLDGSAKTLVDEHPSTFVDSTSLYSHFIRETGEIIWRSERDGWGHLYLNGPDGTLKNQITKGPWVVREVDRVDVKARQITFAASGMDPKEEPYFLHYYRVNFDGTGLTPLTPASGNHTVQWSPDRSVLVDTYSTIDTPPVHELRRASDGALLATLARADITDLKASGWRPPEPFVAKGRDGVTDIYGVVFRPTHFDRHHRYPIVENIYAGPQDSFVPKSFFGGNYMQGVAELGFIVVQIDGMGTRNRSKAFHDVCYKNIADAGFPDRILWMKALAAKDHSVDISRVGVFGTSAGGQNAAGAVLFHPEFYKVAVASCGCHDNRLDKLWWNEQWMGYPVGPEYAAQSNITNAAKLQGHLLLMVGEMDHNVPPETTYRFADALEKANKDFELVVIPGSDHTAGGPYGERKRRDFFVRYLLGVEPPSWNERSTTGETTR